MARIREFDFIDKQKKVIVIYDKMFPLYIIRGDRNFLIDSGATTRSHEFYNRIKRTLEIVGDRKNEKIDVLMFTHSHWDHVGGSYYLQQQFKSLIYASIKAVMVLRKPSAIHFINRLNQDFKKMLNDSSDRIFAQLENLNPLKEGDRIPVSKGSYFEVFDTPGHTRCSTSYLLHPQKILFPGDAAGVLEKDSSIKPLFLSSYIQFMDSVRKLSGLGATVLAFPHNRPFRGVERVNKHFSDCLIRACWLKDQVLEMMKNEKDIKKIAENLLIQEFSKPTLMGPVEAQIINLEAMIKAVQKEVADKKK